MPLSKDAIRNQHRTRIVDSWTSPHHMDGGWHGSDPANDTHWVPRHDRILVQRLPDIHPDRILVAPDVANMICQHRGIIIRTGPGKLVEGVNGGWVRRPVEVLPGQEVIIGPHVDWESEDGQYVLCQEADVRLVVYRTEDSNANVGSGETRGTETSARCA